MTEPRGNRDDTWVDPLIGRALGPYRIMARLGSGGMGTVYEAFDTRLHRAVAVKVLAGPLARDKEALERFIIEARAAARLSHPNVVTVHDVDKADGQCYLVMELVPGGSAQDHVRIHGPLPWREATRMIAHACRGLAAAHDAGLVHRDIKPSNLMRTLDGVVKLADFGLAKSADTGTGVTKPGTVLGTPDYMSPEQCRAERLEARSDLYSLGAAYYFLLTGQTPYQAETAVQVMFSHCSSPVPDPRRACPGVPDACAAVAMRAMAKERSARYPDARSMLRDLEALLGPVTSDTMADLPRLPSRRVRLWPWAVGLLAAVLIVLVVGWQLSGGKREADPEEKPPPLPPSGPLTLTLRKSLPGHKGEMRILRFSSDGKHLVAAGDGKDVTVWRMPDAERLWTLRGHSIRAFCAAFAPDGRTLATGGELEPACLWDLSTGAKLGTAEGRACVFDLAFTRDGKHLVGACGYAGLTIWEREGRGGLRESSLVPTDKFLVTALEFSPDCRTLAAVLWTNSLRLYTVPGYKQAGELVDRAQAAAFSQDGMRLAVGTSTSALVWTPRDGGQHTITRGMSRAAAVAYCGEGGSIVHAGHDETLRLHNLATGKSRTYPHGEGGVRSLALSPDGRTLAVGGFKGTVRLYDVASEE